MLVVDDALMVRELQRSILERGGYAVRTASDGAEALAMLAEQPADLVVTDLEMPNVDGFLLTSSIRAHPRLANIPVLIVSSRASEEDHQRGLDAGADGYIVKTSFDEAGLLSAVSRLLGRSGGAHPAVKNGADASSVRPTRRVPTRRVRDAAVTMNPVDQAALLLRSRAGLKAEPASRARLERLLQESANLAGVPVPSYVNMVDTQPAAFDDLLDRVTVQHSAFFRDPSSVRGARRARAQCECCAAHCVERRMRQRPGTVQPGDAPR